MTDTITCPSGLTGVIKGLKGKSMRLLGDKQAMRSGLFLDKILSACWEQTSDPGPYHFEGSKPDWSKVLIGDRVYALIQIRNRTWGSNFPFKIQCTNAGCRQRFDHTLDLNELPVKPIADEDKAAFSDGNRLTGHLPDGRAFEFRLLTGADEAKNIKQAGSMTDFLGVLKSRIYGIENLDDRGITSYFDESDLSVAYDVLAEMDRHDCGVETKIVVECPDCREALDIEIPFGQGFLTPPRTSTKS